MLTPLLYLVPTRQRCGTGTLARPDGIPTLARGNEEKLCTDENFPQSVVVALRQLGYEVLTAYEAGQANQRIPDQEVLAYAILQKRAVLTQNRKDFIRLHQTVPTHTGIIVCREDHQHTSQLAHRIHLHPPSIICPSP